MFQDRPYQTEAVRSIWDYFRQHAGNPLVAMPTGTGKSVVIARFLQSVFQAYPNQKVMILTHVKELIQQNYTKLMQAWNFAPAGIYSAGLGLKQVGLPILFAGIQSVNKKWALFGHIDLVLIDEAHLVSPTDATMYQSFIAGLRSINPHVKVIGFTATPYRLGHGHLTEGVEDKKGNVDPSLFTDVCFDITDMQSFNRLLAEGYLVPVVPKRTHVKLDVDGVHMRGGEFIESELQAAVNREDITYRALQEAIELGQDRKKWLIFAAGTDHADSIAHMLNEQFHIPCGVVHSKIGERDETLKKYRAGEYRAVVNNNVLTTGFDDPEIDFIIVLRPTASSVLWVQMLGRGTRPYFIGNHNLNTIDGRLSAIAEGGKFNCLVADYAGNTERLGPINDPLIPRKKGEKGGTAPVKLCESCETWNHASRRYCGGQPFKTSEGCGEEFKFLTKLGMQASSNELIKGDLPVVEIKKIDHITFSLHEKDGKPPMMRVNYFCGLKSYDDYVCIEHTDFAGRKARMWWKERVPELPFPSSTAQALEQASQIRPATHLRVWVNKKPYPQIMSVCSDGTAFGTLPQPTPPPPVDVSSQSLSGNSRTREPQREAYYCNDDEIPF